MPSRRSRSARCMPINPAAPVTRTFIATSGSRPLSSTQFLGHRRAGRFFAHAFAAVACCAVLERAQLGVLAEARERADGDMREPCRAVEESGSKHVEAEEPGERRHDETERRRAFAARAHRLGLERRVAILLREIPIERVGGGMQQISPQPTDAACGNDVLMHHVFAPPRAASVEQPQLPVWITLAVREPAAEEAVATRHRIRRVPRRDHRLADRAFERRRYALVRVDAEDPVVRGFSYGEVLLRTVTKPRLHDHPGAEAASDFYGIIATAGIDDDRLG